VLVFADHHREPPAHLGIPCLDHSHLLEHSAIETPNVQLSLLLPMRVQLAMRLEQPYPLVQVPQVKCGLAQLEPAEPFPVSKCLLRHFPSILAQCVISERIIREQLCQALVVHLNQLPLITQTKEFLEHV
jgi:hypothetical protein